MKYPLTRQLLIFLIFINFYSLSAGYLDYPLSYIIESCKITKLRLSPEKEEKEKVLEGRKKYKICMNFIMALSTTLNKRCMTANKEKISPRNSMTYADLSNVSSTSVLINEIINYSLKYPQYDNEMAWFHASRAISIKWPCK